MKYRIVCTTRKENDSIDKLGFIEKDVSLSGYRYLEDKETINRRIRNGDNFFFTNEGGEETEVIAVEDDHVRTSPDGTKKNNLLHLNKCALK
jgi:hypothetical protein